MVASNGAVSFGAYGRMRGCTRQAVSKRVAAGLLDPALVREGKHTLIVPGVADGLWPRRGNGRAPAGPVKPARVGARRAGVNGDSEGITRAEAERRLAVLKLERERFELEKERGAWVRKTEVESDARNAAQRTRDRLLLLPHRVAHRLHMQDAQAAQQVLSAALREALSDLAGDGDAPRLGAAP